MASYRYMMLELETYMQQYANICNNFNIYAVVCVVFGYPVPLIRVYTFKAATVIC